jgi:hypothetical protein
MAARRTPPKGSKPDKLMRDALMVALKREAEDADGKKTRKLYIIADRVDGKASSPLTPEKEEALSFILAGLKVTLGAKLDRIVEPGAAPTPEKPAG